MASASNIPNGSRPAKQRERVAIIGAGNWGSACAMLIGKNVMEHSELFEKEVKIWVFDEQVVGAALSVLRVMHVSVDWLTRKTGRPLACRCL